MTYREVLLEVLGYLAFAALMMLGVGLAVLVFFVGPAYAFALHWAAGLAYFVLLLLGIAAVRWRWGR